MSKKILLAAMPAKKPIYRIRQLQLMLYLSFAVIIIAVITLLVSCL